MSKLAAITTLYILEVKFLHLQKLEDSGMLSNLSCGEFKMADTAAMEQHTI